VETPNAKHPRRLYGEKDGYLLKVKQSCYVMLAGFITRKAITACFATRYIENLTQTITKIPGLVVTDVPVGYIKAAKRRKE